MISVPDNSSSLTGRLPAENVRVYLEVNNGTGFGSGSTEYEMILSGSEWIATGVTLSSGQFFTFATHIAPAPG